MINYSNVNIKLESFFFKPAETEKLVEARKNSILTREQVKEQLAAGNIQVLNPNAETKVAVYVCEDPECETSKYHFYNAHGDLITTFPWDGTLNGISPRYLLYPTSMLYNLQLSATNKGKIIIRSEVNAPVPLSGTEWRGNIYYDGALRYDEYGGVVNFENYPYDIPEEKSLRSRDEKWFKHMEAHGDEYIEYCSNNKIVY